MVGSVMNVGIQGYQNGVQQMNQAAASIARAGTVESTQANNLDQITEAAVELKVGEVQAKASTTVLRAADEVLGTLLDIKA